MTTQRPFQDEIERALRLLCAEGTTFEIRAPETRQRTASGYYRDPVKCALDVARLLDGKAPAVYVTLNPVMPDVWARAADNIKGYAKYTTSDGEVIRRRWLPLDFDSQRPAGISATDAEHDAALARMEAIAAFLSANGWPEPVMGDSGNGGHLLYRIDLPNDEASRELVNRVLQALAGFIDDAEGQPIRVCLDTSVGNPARIWKLYGTIAGKGDSVSDRPHRRAKLLHVPQSLDAVTSEQLEALCAAFGMPKGESQQRAKSEPGRTGSHHIADLGAYLSQHSIGYKDRGVHPQTGSRRYLLDACVWAGHTDHSAWAMQSPDGTIAVGCSHNSCQGKRLREFRDAVEPGWRELVQSASASKSALGTFTSTSTLNGHLDNVQSREFPLIGADGRNHTGGESRASGTSTASGSLTARGPKGEFPLLTVDQLQCVAAVKPEVLVPGKIMRRTLTITYGDADTGKSYYAQHTCFTLAAAGVPVWYVAAEGFDGIYMRILAWLAKHPGQTLGALRVIPVPVNIYRAERAILSAQARDQPEETRPQLVVLDTLHRCSAGARESDNSDMVCVADTAALWRGDFGATTWAIHHEGKGASQGMRGASCLRDDADSVQYVFRGGDYSVIECEKQKDGIPRFEPEAFTLESCSLDEWGYTGLHASTLAPVGSEHIIEARRLWAADQQRRTTGKNAPGNEDDNKALSGSMGDALQVLKDLYEQHPDGVFKATWRTACEAKGIKRGSFDWLTKELEKRGKVRMPDTTGRYFPV